MSSRVASGQLGATAIALVTFTFLHINFLKVHSIDVISHV